METKLKIGQMIDFDTLVNTEAKLYLSLKGSNIFQLGKVAFEVLEDENDGYRSSMDSVKIVSLDEKLTSFLDTVIITKEDENSFSGYRLTSKDDDQHLWLRFGTDNNDDYYPSFTYQWTPKESKELIELKQMIQL